MRSPGYFSSFFICLLCVSLFLPATSVGQEERDEIADLSIEELMDLTVTSVSKKEERQIDAAAAIYVLTQEDLRRSGVSSVADALRMVPGMQVAQIDANKWAISSRGFNDRFANKLLVLIDGRSVYTPLFSGVQWDVQDTRLEDIQRIEVIRGPGATLWGANAVNGIINIITKHPREGQGLKITAKAGTDERPTTSAQYGGTFGSSTFYRAYASFSQRDALVTDLGTYANDDWNIYRGGVRADWVLSSGDITVQADGYGGTLHQMLTLPMLTTPYSRTMKDRMTLSGGNVLARWSRDLSATSNVTGQAYYDRTRREDGLHLETRQTMDFDAQHRFGLGKAQSIVWGVGVRVTTDELSQRSSVKFDPEARSDALFSGFLQDEFTIGDSGLILTIGSKFEHNDYTGFEIQPNSRILWKPHPHHRIWASASRAVRTPSRAEATVHLDFAVSPGTPLTGGLPQRITIRGDESFDSENLHAFEVGYRVLPIDPLSLDLTSFYNVYRNLRTVEPDGDPYLVFDATPRHIVVPLVFSNMMKGETYGLECAATWHPYSSWKLNAGYSWFRSRLSIEQTSTDAGSPNIAGNSPEHQFHLRSFVSPMDRFDFDVALFYVDRLSNQEIPSYVRVDSRVSVQLIPALKISLGVQNMLDPHHPEFGRTPLGEGASEIQRNVYGKMTWQL